MNTTRRVLLLFALLLVCLSLVSFPVQAQDYAGLGHTYYVDATNGLDTNSGQADHPLQTIAKVNALVLRPGDRVLFARGQTWTGTRLTVSYNGSPGRPITYADYGSGALPIIDGTGVTGGFIANLHSYLTVKNLQFQNGTGACMGVYSSHVLLDGLVVLNGGAENIAMNGTTANVNNDIIRNTVVHNAITQGIYVGYSGGADGTGPTNILLEGNTTYSNGTHASLDHGIYLEADSNLVAQDNVAYSNFANGIQVKHMLNSTVERNVTYSNGLSGIWISNQAAGSGFVAKNNLVYGNTTRGIELSASIAGGVSVLHNTVVNNLLNQT